MITSLHCVPKFYNEYFTSFQMNEHKHFEHEIMYIEQGSCLVTCFLGRDRERKDFVLKKGSYICIRSGVVHNLFVDKGSPCKILNTEYRLPNHVAPYDREYILAEDDGSLLRILLLLHDKLRDFQNGLYPDIHVAEEDIGLAVLLLDKKIRLQNLYPSSPTQTHKYIESAKKFIDENYTSKFSISEVARTIALSPAYLQRLFKAETGHTITEYTVALRLERCKYLLTHSTLSIEDIASSTGFGNRQHLTQAFKKSEQISPGQFRKKSLP